MLDNFFHLTSWDNELEDLIESNYLQYFKDKAIKEGETPPNSINELPKLDIEKVRKQIKEEMSNKTAENIVWKQYIIKIFRGMIFRETKIVIPQTNYYKHSVMQDIYVLV